MTGAVSLAVMPRFDPGRDRILAKIPVGASIADMIDVHMPGVPETRRRDLRVTINGNVIRPEFWHGLRPKEGTHVVIATPAPQGDNARTILSLVVVVAAIALGQYYVAAGGPLIAGNAALTSAVVTATATTVGTCLVADLIPLAPAA